MLILIWSAFGVFSQLGFVRLFSTTAGETAYYGNLFFIVAIFALSCGFFTRNLSRYYYFIPLFILLNYFAVQWLGSHSLLQQLPGEYQWGPLDAVSPIVANFDLQLAVLILCATLVPVMILIGAKQGEHMISRDYKKTGYILMAIGGIIGAIVFAIQNQLFPSQLSLCVVWGVGFIVIFWLECASGFKRSAACLTLLPIVAWLTFSWAYSRNYFWSPYQRISTQINPANTSLDLYANGFYISGIQLKTVEAANRDAGHKVKTIPFESVSPGDRALVLGSGGGTNDVREILYRKARSVTAVEIDPRFVELGIEFDPEHTYMRPEVTTHVNDARRFLNTCNEKFDFIYMPFLDSHTNASNQSRFRLDSFLYTKEGLHLAYSKLSDNGVLFVNYGTPTSWMRQRMFNLLQEATGQSVHAFVLPNTAHTTYAVSHGRAIKPAPPPYIDAATIFSKMPTEIVPTDDWPFFYSQFAAIPKEHLRLLYTICMTLLAAFFICRSLVPAQITETLPAPPELCVYAFFSGAAFFFIQIRTISALTPWFGATYISQAMVVIGIILSSLGGAMLAYSRQPLSLPAAWALLFATVFLGFFASEWFHPIDGRLLPSAPLFIAVLLLPTFLAGYIYVRYLEGLSSCHVLDLQLWNLIGGALGGLAEGIIIYIGFHNSLWIVAGFYTLALVAAQLQTPNKGSRQGQV